MSGCAPDQAVWQLVDDVDRSHHFIVWHVILEAERDGVEPITSGTVREGMFRRTGDIPTSDRVLTSMGRLLDEGLLERTPLDDHATGYDWRTTDEGHEVASEIVETWADVLEGVDR